MRRPETRQGAAPRRCPVRNGATHRSPWPVDEGAGVGVSLLPVAGGQRRPPGACRHPAWGGGRRRWSGPPSVGRRRPGESGGGGPPGRCPCPHLTLAIRATQRASCRRAGCGLRRRRRGGGVARCRSAAANRVTGG